MISALRVDVRDVADDEPDVGASASFSTVTESGVTMARLMNSARLGRTLARSVKSDSECSTMEKRNWMIRR